ncbi:hypothetical protein PRIPAC_70802 [Pristionchus pacificus]|uniref:Glycosyltransferase family 92 protein n=1 Tax=Pristionchus pacificus TaxID=54126 RepID=A0A2A6CRD6_PRIPA|nr:hypothetical protein PRIPAC_70802 [Pristionchus pacificus]|eukprot:PDM80784.1 hypothetical protein PRIPAC_35787 [Pristionchus pacificus]
MNLIIDLLDAMSNRRFSGRLIYAFIIILSIYLFFMTTSLVQFTRSIRIYIPSSLNESILLYRAYYDNRTGPGIFRILAVSPCLQSSTHLSIGSDSFHSLLLHSPMEKFCPWKWAPSCKWNAYHFQSQSMPFSPQINVNLYERSVKMDVNSVPFLYETLEVCVPPLYWYDDWPRLILFVEYWKEEGASVSIYVNSVSENVKKVIDYYETEVDNPMMFLERIIKGSIKVINWSMLPRLKDEDPNK